LAQADPATRSAPSDCSCLPSLSSRTDATPHTTHNSIIIKNVFRSEFRKTRLTRRCDLRAEGIQGDPRKKCRFTNGGRTSVNGVAVQDVHPPVILIRPPCSTAIHRIAEIMPSHPGRRKLPSQEIFFISQSVNMPPMAGNGRARAPCVGGLVPASDENQRRPAIKMAPRNAGSTATYF
jgi:hypothetical protein